MGRKAASSEDDSGIQSPDCRPDDNDNSVSVYLDANEEAWHAEYDDQNIVTITQNQDHESDNVFSDAAIDGEQERQGSGDSSGTEAQLCPSEDKDSDDEEEEDSFLSLRSADEVMRKQSEPEEVQMCSKRPNKRPSVSPVTELHQESFQDLVDLPNEEGQMCSSTMRPSVHPVNNVHQKALQDSTDLSNEEVQMCSLDMRPTVGLVSELRQEASHVFHDDKSKMNNLTQETDMVLGSENDHMDHQETDKLQNKEEQMKYPKSSLDVRSVNEEVLQESMKLYNQENQLQTSSKKSNVALVNEIHQESGKTTTDLSTEKSQPPSELIFNQTMPPSLNRGSAPIQNIKDPKRNISQSTNDPPDLSHTRSPIKPTKFKSTKMELKRFSRPNLKDVKPKVISRATSVSRPVNTDNSQLAVGFQTTRSRAANRREQGDDVVKKNRASSIQARMTTPIMALDSDGKSTLPSMVQKQPPETSGSKVVTNIDYVQTIILKDTEPLRDERGERGSHRDKAVVKETSKDGDMDQVSASICFCLNA